jgi:phage regulator Rha-like protein
MAQHSLVTLHQGEPVTGSDVIAEQTQVQHKSILQLIRGHRADLEEFGLVAFEMRPRPEGKHGGGDMQIALLNEQQATLLLTYMRNNDIVRAFKKTLVKAFFQLRDLMQEQAQTPPAPEAVTITASEYIELLKAKIALLEGPARESRPPVEPITDDEKAHMYQLADLGLGHREIARRTGRSAAAVSYIVRAYKEQQS